MKINRDNQNGRRNIDHTINISVIFIASILLIGSLLPTSLDIFPVDLSNKVYADKVTGTDDNDNLEGSDVTMKLKGREAMIK